MQQESRATKKSTVRKSAVVLIALAVSAIAGVSYLCGSAPSSALLFPKWTGTVTVRLFTNQPSRTGLVYVENNKGREYEMLTVNTAGESTLTIPNGPREKVTKICLCATSRSWTGSLEWIQQDYRAYAKEGGRGKRTLLSFGGANACQPYTIGVGKRPLLRAGVKRVSYDKCGLKTWYVVLQSRMTVPFSSFLDLAVDSDRSARLERSAGTIPARAMTTHQSLLVQGLKKHFCVCAPSNSGRFIGNVPRIVAPKWSGAVRTLVSLNPVTATAGAIDLSPGRCAIFNAKETGVRRGFSLRGYANSCPDK